ncbi:MAG: GNAT family N-acetyltransferase [Sedimentisphaerales bacterium]|nr:GNAT family N-acetyltransferase [Sedimentisphaerales bacterium]
MMEFAEITDETAPAFFSCLHLEEPQDPESTISGRQWYAAHKDKGYRAKVLTVDGSVVGKCHYGPIEISPLEGKNTTVIFCLCVHPYEYPPGDHRDKGYGRFMLEAVEKDARDAGVQAVAAWAMDWHWNPVSFYLHAGYTEVDREDKVVAVWKPFAAGAEPPRILRLPSLPPARADRVTVLVADNPWCDGFDKKRVAREAVEGLEDIVDYIEVAPPYDGRMIHLGRVGGVYLDGEPYRPYELIGASSELRRCIMERSERKRLGSERK